MKRFLMASKKLKHKLEEIILRSLDVEVIKPFSEEMLKNSEVTVVPHHTYHFDSKRNTVLIFVVVEFKISEKKRIKNKEKRETNFSISIEYVIFYKNLSKAKRESIEEFYPVKAYRDIWPYIRNDIDMFLSKARYHPYYLQVFDEKFLQV